MLQRYWDLNCYRVLIDIEIQDSFLRSKVKVSFPIRLDARGQRRCLYETTPKWHGFLMIKLAETVNRLNVEHRTLNVERPILMALRFIYFITSEPQNYELRITKDGIASLCLF